MPQSDILSSGNDPVVRFRDTGVVRSNRQLTLKSFQSVGAREMTFEAVEERGLIGMNDRVARA